MTGVCIALELKQNETPPQHSVKNDAMKASVATGLVLCGLVSVWGLTRVFRSRLEYVHHKNSAAGFAEVVKSRVTALELRDWARSFLANPPAAYTNTTASFLMSIEQDPVWRRIPAPCNPWVIMGSTDHPGRTTSVHVVSMGGFGSYSIYISPFDSLSVVQDEFTSEIEPGIVVCRHP